MEKFLFQNPNSNNIKNENNKNLNISKTLKDLFKTTTFKIEINLNNLTLLNLNEKNLYQDEEEDTQNDDYAFDILLPLIIGLLVALILGWMLVRYKMSSHQRSNYNGSIYCCPDQCFEFCTRFFECNFR